MLALELGEPKSLKLRAFWAMLETMSKGLTCQLVTIPLFKDHEILVQVAGHGSRAIKLLPTLTLDDDDCAWIERGFADDAGGGGRVGGAGVEPGQDADGGRRAARRRGLTLTLMRIYNLICGHHLGRAQAAVEPATSTGSTSPT